MTRTFAGYRRDDGSVGVRNHVAVVPTVVCANAVIERLDRAGTDLALVTHQHGCAQVGDDLQLTRRVLAGIASNPNVGATLLVSLGCETNVGEHLAKEIAAGGRPVELFRIQDYGGITATYEAVYAAATRHSDDLARQQRTPIPLSELIVGLECGGFGRLVGPHREPGTGASCRPPRGRRRYRRACRDARDSSAPNTCSPSARPRLASRTDS